MSVLAEEPATGVLPPPIVVGCKDAELDTLLEKEWLLTNKIGAYASGTVVGCNTRRYHGLLVAATAPPVGRVVALSTVMEQIIAGDTTYDPATNEFPETFSPRGAVHLLEFRNDVAPTFVFRIGKMELVKEILLAEAANAVALRYTLHGGSAKLRLRPFAALRDYHVLRKADEPHQMTFETVDAGVTVQDRLRSDHVLHVISREAQFVAEPQWWRRLLYRADAARGQDGLEDLYTPGFFDYDLAEGIPCQITASLNDPLPVGFQTTMTRRRERLGRLIGSIGSQADESTRRLAGASDAFVVLRSIPNAAPSASILAGFHWFADWGRDAFIALPGLMLATKRFDEARQVFRTFANHIANGMVPSRFDNYTAAAHYNSIDTSLWFIVAAERYMAATADAAFWRETLMPAAKTILNAYNAGTLFDIRADADGLLAGGSAKTQLTWMDVKLGEKPVTSRHGKAVEVNALWYCAHRIMACRCKGLDDGAADIYAQRAEIIAPAFMRTFWNDELDCLYDCVTDGAASATLRPNQIFAVSLPYSPLSADQQAAVVRTVVEKLLTPRGPRTLAPDDAEYCRHYGGPPESRDRAYHQGTVWPWLIGALVEAVLKTDGPTPPAVKQAGRWLAWLDEHLAEAGLGFVSEIFDGDPPHAPRGCIAQAWSVGELLRAKLLLADAQKSSQRV